MSKCVIPRSQWHECEGQRRTSLMECEAFAWNMVLVVSATKKPHALCSHPSTVFHWPGIFHIFFFRIHIASSHIFVWSVQIANQIHFALHIYCTNIRTSETYLMRFDSLKRSRTPSQHHSVARRTNLPSSTKISPISIIIFSHFTCVFTVMHCFSFHYLWLLCAGRLCVAAAINSPMTSAACWIN